MLHLPEYYFYKFKFDAGSASFMHMSRQSFKDSAFLDRRIRAIPGASMEYLLADLLPLWHETGLRTKGVNYIFHTAYCCSTLLSRIIDVNNKTLVYREPIALHQLAVMRRRKKHVPENLLEYWDEYLDLTIGMLSKTWSGRECPIIKATDSCNNVIDRLLAKRPGSSAILMYSQLEDFLISNLKSAGRREFMRKLLNRARLDAVEIPSLHDIDTRTLDDARAAAFVWMVQMQSYREVLRGQAGACKTLDASKLLASPRDTFSAVSRHLDLKLTSEDIHKVLAGPAWNRHAKDISIGDYGTEQRLQEKKSLFTRFEKEITGGINWVTSFPGWCSHVEFGADIRDS